jgi:HK97 family phage portal protein
MKIFGIEIPRRKKELSPIYDSRGWVSLVQESFAGAWQRNAVPVNQNLALSYYAVFACTTLIARDIAKLRVKFIREKPKGVWQEAEKSNYDALLAQPNAYQNRLQFWESYFLSKLTKGNVYVLKRYDQRPQVSALHILDPNRVQVLVSESGDVFYRLQQDNMSGIITAEGIAVPASEIIHDRMNCLFHPLVGLSPLYAAGLAAMQGLSIQNNATKFFTNRSVPGGIITAPQTIPTETADRLKKDWNERYGPDGTDSGKTAILGDGLEFKPMAVTAHDAQLIEQLKWTAENVCSCFHIPPYKIGIGTPLNNNVQSLNLEYYSQALQSLIEEAETCLDRGLALDSKSGVEFDIENLLRMDTVSQINSLKEALGAALLSPNEGRAKLGYGPVKGGESPRAQQQMFTLEALAERDADKPFAKPAPPAPAPGGAPVNAPDDEDQADDEADKERGLSAMRKGYSLARVA